MKNFHNADNQRVTGVFCDPCVYDCNVLNITWLSVNNA